MMMMMIYVTICLFAMVCSLQFMMQLHMPARARRRKRVGFCHLRRCRSPLAPYRARRGRPDAFRLIINHRILERQRVYCLVNIADNDARQCSWTSSANVKGRKDRRLRRRRWTVARISEGDGGPHTAFRRNDRRARMRPRDSTSSRHQTSVAANRFSVAEQDLSGCRATVRPTVATP